MASIPVSLESSLPVPNVQELAIQRPDKVPLRYIRDDVDDIATAASYPTLPVPLIDVAKLINTETQEKELQKLHLACKDWGVFQLVNHGVCDESLKNTRKQVEGFFELPLEEKKRWEQKPGSLEGYGQAFVTSEEQKLEWNDMIFLKSLPEKNRQLDLWPENPPQFSSSAPKHKLPCRFNKLGHSPSICNYQQNQMAKTPH
ncbi:hypothetical protein L6164_022970 [Bauhinia variegata]|uniref:Uncharacterized protein n=1 Tax=Bauhinia variegata TaxID=167791 RepID=A0ACB9MJU8_BAUVA|nr:hypothetical protein L6164_022970 [Bauhinia variegata]